MLWLKNSFSSSMNRAIQFMRGEARIAPISAASLASLSDRAGESLILFDLRNQHEIEQNSYSIPGALLTTNFDDLSVLVRWIPRDNTVVLYAEKTIPVHDCRLHLPAKKLKMFALEGGLRSWWKAGLPLEPVDLTDRRWVDNR